MVKQHDYIIFSRETDEKIRKDRHKHIKISFEEDSLKKQVYNNKNKKEQLKCES